MGLVENWKEQLKAYMGADAQP